MNHSEIPSRGSVVQEVGVRLRALWAVKTVGLTVGIPLFFAAYFYLLRHPQFPVTVMPLTWMDRLVTIRAEALPLYFSLWFYVPLAVGLLKERAELWAHALAAGALSVVGLTFFFFWPTTVPPLDVDWSAHPSLAFLKTVDAAGNACPSLHVAFGVFTALCIGRVLRLIGAGVAVRAGNVLWSLGIVYSTLATGQHVALDVLAGGGLGALAAWPVARRPVA